MSSPSVLAWVYIQVTKGTAICNCQRFCRDTLLPFNMSLVFLLMHSFFASRTPFEIFAIFALAYLMGGVCVDFYSLLAFLANH